MTPLMMQDSLVERVQRDLSNMKLMDGRSFTAYPQHLPPRKADKDTSIYPFARVYLGDGEDTDDDATQDVVVVLATRDTSENMQGYRDVMNAIQRLRESLCKAPSLDRRYEIRKPIKWMPPDADATFPEFYGAIQFTVGIPQIERSYDNL